MGALLIPGAFRPPPMAPPPSRLENLAWSLNLSPDWLRAYIRREMTRRLGPETSDGRVQATCSGAGVSTA